MIIFRILTFVTDHEIYSEMLNSFAVAGFCEANSTFERVDNSAGNVGDPYSCLNRMLDAAAERYVIVCHQDVRLDQGSGVQDLISRLRGAGDEWAVAGPAGMSLDYRQVLAITDPWDAPRWPGPWPVEVQALDELLVVIRPGRARLSDGLSGFHFYGLDLCLSAQRKGWTALAIDFPLTHLSNGRRGQASDAYRRARADLQRDLAPLYAFRLAVTNTGEGIVLSRYPLLQRVADRERARSAVKAFAQRRGLRRQT